MAKEQPINVAMIGAGFMGRAHSHAWASVNQFFDPPRRARMQTVVCRDARRTEEFARRWGWADFTTDLRSVLNDDSIDLIDIVTPNHLHAEFAIAALEAGKHVACEKPLAGILEDARRMRDAVYARSRKRRTGKRQPRTFVWFNYRRSPAVALAHQLAAKGKLGKVFQVRAQYLQDWGRASTSMSWRFQSKLAGSGAHGDLNSHIIDMARFITGDEITEVSGAVEGRFIAARQTARKRSNAVRKAKSTVDDCALFLARFESGAVGSFEATRVATGNLNRNAIEINGEFASLKFDFERMNELQWWDDTLPQAMRGWSRILCTTPVVHPYVEAYWPPGHLIGYEHGFVSQAADILAVLSGGKAVVPLPDFEDAYQTQRVLHAAMVAAREQRAVKLREIE
jgi:predicted dehydrogenase